MDIILIYSNRNMCTIENTREKKKKKMMSVGYMRFQTIKWLTAPAV